MKWWKNLGVEARIEFFDNITTLFFVLGLIIPFMIALMGAALHSGLVIAGGMMWCIFAETTACFSWTFGKWLAKYYPCDKE